MSEFDNDNGNVQDNEMDRLLQGAFESRPRVGGSGPSMIDVRHRARRYQRRRVGGVVGATAMLGVTGVAVLASRGSSETGLAGDEPTTTLAMTDAGLMCGYTAVAPTTTTFEDVTSTITWLGTTLPSEATTTTMSGSPGCVPSGQFRCWGNLGTDDQGYSYFEICDEIAREQSAYPYPQTTMPDYTTYEVFDTTTTFLPDPTTTVVGPEATATTVMATTTP